MKQNLSIEGFLNLSLLLMQGLDRSPLWSPCLARNTQASYLKNVTLNVADCAQNRNNLAWVLFKKGKFEEAELLYMEALKIRQASLGPEHPDVARSRQRNDFLIDPFFRFE
jgi:hypothetical protein